MSIASLVSSGISKVGELQTNLFRRRVNSSGGDSATSHSTNDLDADLLAEEEPVIVSLKKHDAPRTLVGQAERLWSNFNKSSKALPSVPDSFDIPSLNEVMKQWLHKLQEEHSVDLKLQLDNFIAEILCTEIPFSTNSTESNQEQIPEEKPSGDSNTQETGTGSGHSEDTKQFETKKFDLASEDEILRKFQAKQGQKVQEFISFMVGQFPSNPAWGVPKTPKERDDLWECLERYIIVKISRKTFLANKVADYRFWQLLQTLNFIVPKHLDIKHDIPQDLIQQCSIYLTQMNFFKTPRNKLICIANCCITVFNFLTNVQQSRAQSGTVTADDFLPVLTFIVIKANTPNLISNLGFIEDFRHEALLLSSWGYFLTNFHIVIDFINNLNPKQLSTGQELSLGIEDEWVLLKETYSKTPRKSSLNSLRRGPTTTTTTTTPPSTTNDSPTSDVSIVDDVPFNQRYKFWNYASDEITPDLIPELLAEYKRLALVEFTTFKKKKD